MIALWIHWCLCYKDSSTFGDAFFVIGTRKCLAHREVQNYQFLFLKHLHVSLVVFSVVMSWSLRARYGCFQEWMRRHNMKCLPVMQLLHGVRSHIVTGTTSIIAYIQRFLFRDVMWHRHRKRGASSMHVEPGCTRSPCTNDACMQGRLSLLRIGWHASNAGLAC